MIRTRTHGGPRMLEGLAAALAAVAALAAGAGGAGAIVIHGPGPDASYQPRNGAAAATARFGSNLDYHGGPVMHSSTTYAMYWAPGGSFPSGYKTLMNRYLSDVGTDSGQSTNVYTVG